MTRERSSSCSFAIRLAAAAAMLLNAGNVLATQLFAPPKTSARQAGSPAATDTSAANEKLSGTVVARVGDWEVFDSEARQVLAGTRRGKEADPAELPKLEAQALGQVVNRALALLELEKLGFRPSEGEIDDLLDDLKRRLEEQQISFETYLANRNATPAALRRQLMWDVAWGRYRDEAFTDEAVQAYFEAHARDFDGTKVRVSHILFRPTDSQKKRDWQAARKQASDIRKEIQAGKLTFAEAAEKYSAGPSRKEGGDIGFISRHGEMVESFSRAAFALEEGKLSSPVTTIFGVHLIQCTGVTPGKRSWTSVRPDLEQALSRQHFSELADKARERNQVVFTGAMPYFDLKTRKLVPASPGATAATSETKGR